FLHVEDRSAIFLEFEMDIVHEALDVENSSAGWIEKIFGKQRIFYCVGIKTLAFILNGNAQFLVDVVHTHFDLLAEITIVAMFDGVADTFTYGENDPVRRILVESNQIAKILDQVVAYIDELIIAVDDEINFKFRIGHSLEQSSLSACFYTICSV